MDGSASLPRNKTATVVDVSPMWKRSKHYRDVKELLLLHRRYEVNAMRALRRVTTALNPDKEIRRRRITRTMSAEGSGETSVSHDTKIRPPLRIKKEESLAKDKRLIDSEYLNQIMSRIDRNMMELSLAEPAPKANALRLPKLECIPRDSKAIFYTSVPSIPSLPKASPRSVKRINRRYQQKSDMSQYSLSDNCLTVRQLPSDHTMLRDVGAIDAVKLTNHSSSSGETLALQITAPGHVISTEHHKAASEELYWLVPVLENNERAFRLNIKTCKGDRASKVNKDSKGREKRGEAAKENATPKYKRNVHFSEFLHEVHLYTPLSTKH